MYSLPRRMVAEFVGTFTLIFIGAGSVCADAFIKAGGGTGPGLLGAALAHGLAIAVMVTALGHISGAHFNPAVTIGVWVTKRMDTVDALLYWASQLAGGIAGAHALRALVPSDTWRAVWLGAAALAPGVTNTTGMLLEGVMTFFLVFVVFATAVDERSASGKFAGFAIGLTITMDILVGGPLTGAALNPARALGPAIAAKYWTAHGVYWVGPLAGGVFAGWLYDTLFLKK